MRKTKIIIFSLIAMFAVSFVSCQSVDEPIPHENQIEEGSSLKVQLALKNASACIERMEGSKSNRTVKSLQPLFSPQTRAENEQPIFYLVNYENNGGFAIFSIDSRTEPIMAISDTGNLSISDTVDNEGLQIFFGNLRELEASASGFPSIPDSIGVEPGVDPGIIDPGISTEPFYNWFTKPLLAKPTQTWWQTYPFNELTGNHPVGCMALACAQLMSVYEWPESYNGVTFDWTAINNWDRESSPNTMFEVPGNLTYLLKALGDKENLNLSYGTETGGSERYLKRTLKNFGYNALYSADFAGSTLGDIMKPYDEEKRISLIKARHPLLALGTKTDSKRHMWIIDGIYQYGEFYYNHPELDKVTLTLFHCVWGNTEGRGNGYFRIMENATDGINQRVVGQTGTLENVPKYKNLKYFGGLKKNI